MPICTSVIRLANTAKVPLLWCKLIWVSRFHQLWLRRFDPTWYSPLPRSITHDLNRDLAKPSLELGIALSQRSERWPRYDHQQEGSVIRPLPEFWASCPPSTYADISMRSQEVPGWSGPRHSSWWTGPAGLEPVGISSNSLRVWSPLCLLGSGRSRVDRASSDPRHVGCLQRWFIRCAEIAVGGFLAIFC